LSDLLGHPEPFFSLLELQACDADSYGSAIAQLRQGLVTGIIVRNVYDSVLMQRIVERLERHDPPFLKTWFPEKFKSWFYGQNLNLMQTDPDILEPDCLNVDLSKITKENINHYQQKAIRRGKYGFHLGRHMEVIPHFRRPHPALMWTGHGRTIPRIVFRKGSLVHREVIEKMPTGREQQL
jgi:hypothetical protein